MSKKENVRFLPPVKRYVNAVERRLHLPLREKARVMSDISTSIAARHEAGESYEAIMADMGTPEAVAQPFNRRLPGNTRAVRGAFCGWRWPWPSWRPRPLCWFSPPAWPEAWKWRFCRRLSPGPAPLPQASLAGQTAPPQCLSHRMRASSPWGRWMHW